MIQQIPRDKIKGTVERLLWGRAAGRCQFDGCNQPVWRTPVSGEEISVAEMGHIYSYSDGGPRSNKGIPEEKIDSIHNLLLVCRGCHKTIDFNDERYTADLLLDWKRCHEERVFRVTGIAPERRSHVVTYGATIGERRINLSSADASNALFEAERYPAAPDAIRLEMAWEGRYSDSSYWDTEQANLVRGFTAKVETLLSENRGAHFSVFGLAPMPLLIQLGALFTDKVPVDVYQRRREPAPTWQWSADEMPLEFMVDPPDDPTHQPVVLFSLSDQIVRARVEGLYKQPISVWEMTVATPGMDLVQHPSHLSAFREAARTLMGEVAKGGRGPTPAHVYPVMPVATAIELGRVRMSNAWAPWEIYDYHQQDGGFHKALTIK